MSFEQGKNKGPMEEGIETPVLLGRVLPFARPSLPSFPYKSVLKEMRAALRQAAVELKSGYGNEDEYEDFFLERYRR